MQKPNQYINDDDLRERLEQLEAKMAEIQRIVQMLREAFAKLYEDQRRKERIL